MEPTNCLVKTNWQKRRGAQQKRTHDLIHTPSKTFNIISHGELLQQVRTHQKFWVMANKSILTKHHGKIQHISPDGLEKGDRIEKKIPSYARKKKTFYEEKLKVKCIKA